MLSIAQIRTEFPLHWLVWNDDHRMLQDTLHNEQAHNIEKRDARGRTPLMLAVRLNHLQSVRVLLAARCDANVELNGWSVVQEAVCTGNEALLTAILEVRDLQRHVQRVTHVPQLLQRLVDAPDFYIEMKWEFTSWVPLMSRMCPSDTYRVYKRGANVRIDTTLLGFDQTTWQRGNRSYIFKGQQGSATMIEIDHVAREVSVEQMQSVQAADISVIPPNRESVAARLNAPVSTNHVDMEKISFERNKSGIWGWRSDKSEEVSGYDCKVFAASNVEFVSMNRSDHLSEEQANRFKNSRNPLQNFLGLSDDDSLLAAETASTDRPPAAASKRRRSSASSTPTTPVDGEFASARSSPVPEPMAGDRLTPEEYFSAGVDLAGRDIGRPVRVQSKVQRFKANVWLSETYPIQLQEQVLPILDLMSTMASPHVSKLKDFITMQLPAGFPVKIEIPLFHVLNACVTFCNVFALDSAVPHVSHIRESTVVDANDGRPAGERLTCIVDDCVFDIPANYANKGADHRRQLTFEDEDDLLQFAIQQSLLETGSESEQVDIWEALKARRPVTPNPFGSAGAMTAEDDQLQRVLQESLYGYHSHQLRASNGLTDDDPESSESTATSSTTPNSSNAERSPWRVPSLIAGDPTATRLPPVRHESVLAVGDEDELDHDDDLALALRISEREQRDRLLEAEREQKMLDDVLQLSLQEN